LGVAGGDAVAEGIASFVRMHRDRYDLVVTTQDWHIDPGEHFSDNPDFVDTWPPHGVAGTPEAELHQELADLNADVSVKKGEYEAAYSGFEGKDEQGRLLADVLREAGITAVDVVGLVESHCVKETAIDARQAGLQARVLTDLTVPVSPELGAQAREQMTAAGVELLESSGV